MLLYVIKTKRIISLIDKEYLEKGRVPFYFQSKQFMCKKAQDEGERKYPLTSDSSSWKLAYMP